LPGFVDFLAGKADIVGRRLNVLAGNIYRLTPCRVLAPPLRRVVFVGEAALCQRFDFQCVGLRAEGPP
jgi:hypothetical protein